MTLIEKGILEIILKLYIDEEKTDPSLDEFAIFISSITPFLGDARFARDVRLLCNKIGLEIDDTLSDPDWPDDPEGSVIVNKSSVMVIFALLNAEKLGWEINDLSTIKVQMNQNIIQLQGTGYTIGDKIPCDIIIVRKPNLLNDLVDRIPQTGVCLVFLIRQWILTINKEIVGGPQIIPIEPNKVQLILNK